MLKSIAAVAIVRKHQRGSVAKSRAYRVDELQTTDRSDVRATGREGGLECLLAIDIAVGITATA